MESRVKAMVAFELKMGKFRPSYLGQLSTYLSALDKIEKKPDENPSVGIPLCEKMNKPFVQLAVQDFSKPIGIATYQTLRTIPKPYRELAPVIEGVRKALMESPVRARFDVPLPERGPFPGSASRPSATAPTSRIAPIST